MAINVPGVASVSDMNAGLQAAIVASENAAKTRQQILELIFRSGLEATRAAEQRRAFGIEERKASALEAFHKTQASGIEAQTALDKLRLQEAQRVQGARERFAAIQVSPSLGPMSPVLPPEAQFQRRIIKMAERDPVGASLIARETEGLFDLQERVMKLEQGRLALAGGQEALEESQELRPLRKQTAELEVSGKKAEQEMLPERKAALVAQTKQAEAGAFLATEQAEERKSRRKLLESGFDKKSIGEISQEFTDEELQATGKSRESLERDIEETARQLVLEEKLPTKLAIKDRITQSQLVLGLRRQQIEETAIPAETRRITRKVDRETTAITKAIASGITQEQILGEMDDQMDEVGNISGFNTMENAVQQGEYGKVVKALNLTLEKMTAQGVTKDAVIGTFRRQHGSEFVNWARVFVEIDKDGNLVHSRYQGDQRLKQGQEFQTLLNMLGIKAEDLLQK